MLWSEAMPSEVQKCYIAISQFVRDDALGSIQFELWDLGRRYPWHPPPKRSGPGHQVGSTTRQAAHLTLKVLIDYLDCSQKTINIINIGN